MLRDSYHPWTPKEKTLLAIIILGIGWLILTGDVGAFTQSLHTHNWHPFFQKMNRWY